MLKPWRIQKYGGMLKPWSIQKYWRTEKTRCPPMLAQQEKVGGDAEELPYCKVRQNLQQLTSLRPR
jgi:hypothetical protein